jgi:hypothetical protein
METAELMAEVPLNQPHLRRSSVTRLATEKRDVRGCTDIQGRLNLPFSKPPAFISLLSHDVSFALMTDSTSPKYNSSIGTK